MPYQEVYIAISIAALAVIAVLLFFLGRKKGKKSMKLTPLAGLAFAFVLAGIIFGEDRFVGYGLMAVGIILAVADAVRSRQK